MNVIQTKNRFLPKYLNNNLNIYKNYFVFFSLLFLIAISSISNTSISIISAKLFLSATFYFLLFKLENYEINSVLEDLSKLKIFIILIIFSGISLIYSSNLSYGVSKILNLITGLLILLSFSLFIRNIDNYKSKNLLILIASISTLTLIVIIIVDPFDQSRLYQFEFTRWSHVIFSRMMSIMYFIILISFIYSQKRKTYLVFTIILALMFYQIYYANLRAATFGVIIFSLIILSIALIKKQLDFKKISYLALALALTITLIIITPTTDYFDFRYKETAKVLSGNLPEEGGINARFIAYEKAWEIIGENPILGIGFGSYNGYDEDEFLSLLKYPHNIFLEFQVELGIFGTLFFLYFLISTWKLLYKFNKYALIVWLFTIWLALFAKDIATNLLVFMPLILNDNKVRTE